MKNFKNGSLILYLKDLLKLKIPYVYHDECYSQIRDDEVILN